MINDQRDHRAAMTPLPDGRVGLWLEFDQERQAAAIAEAARQMREAVVAVGKAEARREAAAKRIDLRTAEAWWSHVDVMNPYGEFPSLTGSGSCIGRDWFVRDPVERVPVLVHEVRALHTSIPEDEWNQLVDAAVERADVATDNRADGREPASSHPQTVLHTEIDASPEAPPTGSHRQFDALAGREALKILGSVPWGDLQADMSALEEATRLGLVATRTHFLRWEEESFDHGFADEFSVPPNVVDSFSNEWLLAYVARLLRTIAMFYGAQTEFGLGNGELGAIGFGERKVGSILKRLDGVLG